MERVIRINALLEALRASPRRIHKIMIQKDGGRVPLGEVTGLAKAAHIPCSFVPKAVLDKIAPRHQGVVAFMAAKEFLTFQKVLDSAPPVPFFVLLDEIEDPQNLGAILRSAEGAGVDGVILPERRSAGLTEAVHEVSAGALEHLKVARVVNLAQTMEALKDRGVWIVGAEAGGEGLYFDFDYTQPLALVLGSEGRGLRRLVREKCDRILSVPMRGKVNSLNVSAAAAVFFFEAVRQRLRAPRVS